MLGWLSATTRRYRSCMLLQLLQSRWMQPVHSRHSMCFAIPTCSGARPCRRRCIVCPHLCLQMKEQITGADAAVALRRRLPRCIRGDRILTPFAVGPAIGLALLHNSGVGPLANLVKGAAAPISLAGGSSSGGAGSGSGSGDGVGDAYETHLTLPMGNVAMITNYRLLLLSAPEFAVLEADVLSGRRKHVRRVCEGGRDTATSLERS